MKYEELTTTLLLVLALDAIERILAVYLESERASIYKHHGPLSILDKKKKVLRF